MDGTNGNGNGQPARRGRGRPPGSRNKPKKLLTPEQIAEQALDAKAQLQQARARIIQYAEEAMGRPLPTLEQALERYRFDLDEKAREQIIQKCRVSLPASTRARAPLILTLHAHGFGQVEIGMVLGIHPQLVQFDIHSIRRVGYLDNPKTRIDQQIVPAAVETVHRAIAEHGNVDAAVEVLKGRGQFKTHQAIKGGERAATMILGVRIMLPDGTEMKPAGQIIEGQVVRGELPEMREGSVHGTPIEKAS